MASPSPPPELVVKKDSISFALPPPQVHLPRLSQDIVTLDQQPREHPESSHRRSSSADAIGSSRRARGMGSPPPPSAYTPRGCIILGSVD